MKGDGFAGRDEGFLQQDDIYLFGLYCGLQCGFFGIEAVYIPLEDF